ncbi:restriction endonuclease subunit S [Xanthobacter autotrophicus]|uniref:restriction endonuclease subunit S n=1 Tax=Xanthobacter autotrophicus TaxID=280 RepID=UPI00372CAF5C
MSGLPKGWVTPEIGDLCALQNGKAFKPSDWATTGTPIIRIQNLNNKESMFNYFNGEIENRFEIKNDDLLFAWSGTPGTSFGAHIWDGGRAVLNQHIFRIDFNELTIYKPYFRYAINQKLDQLINQAHGGVGLAHVTKGKFEKTQIPLPPLPEQRRIVAKIESLAARSKRARADLTRVERLVETAKQAVVQAAFSNISFSLPLKEIITEGPSNGWSPKGGPDATGTRTLKLSATTLGYFRCDDAAIKRIYEHVDVDSKFWLLPGDILIQRANSLEYVGVTAIYTGPPNTFIYPDLMMRIRAKTSEDAIYIWRYLSSLGAREYFRSHATGTAGNMPKINGQTVREFMVPWPEPPERLEIVRRIEAAFARLDALAAEARKAAHLLAKLDQAVLAKAFRGELVPQDPDDEPAEVLLARIRAERAAAGTAKAKAKAKAAPSDAPPPGAKPRRGRPPRSA